MSDAGALTAAVAEVIAANPGPVGEYRGGKEASLQFLLGQAMKATKGAGNPQTLRQLLIQSPFLDASRDTEKALSLRKRFPQRQGFFLCLGYRVDSLFQSRRESIILRA